MAEESRAVILTELAKHTGKLVPAAFLYHTAVFIPNVERFHTLISGIYKPAWSEYALSIVMKLGSPYEHKDEVVFLEDGRWLMTYSPRLGGLHLSDNRALIKCMDDRVPLGVFQQLTGKADKRHRSTYRILGLGQVTGYDANADLFILESCDRAALEQITSIISDEKARYEIQLYTRLTNEFRPFGEEVSITHTVSTLKRDEAFRHIVLEGYSFTCAACETRFRLGSLIEATAAHIVPKRKSGTDDPRNGLALCRTHHWAFDAGLFSLSDDYRVIVSPAVNHADTHNFTLLDLNGKAILLPQNDGMQPHPKALAWHRAEVLIK